MKSKNLYNKPLKKRDDLGRPPNYKHTGNQINAEDFLCRIGSPILAAADGKVLFSVDKFDVKQDDERLKNPEDPGNNILIGHDNNENTFYAHLRKGGALVKSGEEVKKGQVIGYSGNTGYSHKPHLHYSVIIPEDSSKPLSNDNFKTLKPRWEK
jgi:murein DD-endopeptidase MepM/ murein hydrolase activator NlpD